MKQIARGQPPDWSSSFVETHIFSIGNLSAPVLPWPPYPLSQGDMRYLKVPGRRVRSAQSSKGKRLIYLSLVGGTGATFWISFLNSWYLSRLGLIW